MRLIPYAGAERDEDEVRPVPSKKFDSLALLSMRAELNALARRHKKLQAANEDLRLKLMAAKERADSLENLVKRASSILEGPRVNSNTSGFADAANRIVLAVSDYFKMAPMMIFGRARTKDYTVARHIAMYLVHHELGASVAAVGRYFDGRDHTTVIHAIRNVTTGLTRFSEAAEAIKTIRGNLKGTPSGVSEAVPSQSPPSLREGTASLPPTVG